MPNGDGVHRELGDAIEGERIVCQFRKMSDLVVGHGTAAHRASETKLYNAYCSITKPLRAL